MSDRGRPSTRGGPWILVGAGGHARSVYDAIVRAGELLIGVCAANQRPSWLPDDVMLFSDRDLDHEALPIASWLVAVGDSADRQRLTEQLVHSHGGLGIFIATTATVATDARLSPGAMVLEHAHVGPGASVGTSTIINTSAVVEHDSHLGSFSHIAPKAVILGGGSVGDRVLIGSSAVVLSCATIADDVIVGAGAVVTRPFGPSVKIAGVPARQIRRAGP